MWRRALAHSSRVARGPETRPSPCTLALIMTTVAPDPTDEALFAELSARFPGKLFRPHEAVADLRPGQRVFVGSGAAEPQALARAVSARARELPDTEILHMLTMGVAPWAQADFGEGFRHNAFFIGANTRGAVSEGRADYTPVFLSELPALLRSGRHPIDVALIQVSPPDHHGWVSLGVSVDIVKAAAESARLVVAQVNPHMPRTLGDSGLPVSRIDRLVPVSEELVELPRSELDETAMRIGRFVAELVQDGSTLQTGIGAIPDAVLACLGDKRDLGVHTEMFSDGLIPLVEAGVINGRKKRVQPGRIVTSFVLGSSALYKWVDDHPLVSFHPSDYVNDPFRIARNERMVAINSALQVDLTGQVNADSIGPRFFSGIGGQVDFIRGAARSAGGKPIIALRSTAKGGSISRLVAELDSGSSVTTSRGDVHWVVTEYGAADLHGRSVRERALALAHIAHPDFREELLARAKQRHLVPVDQVAVKALGTPALDAMQGELTMRDGTAAYVRPMRPTDADELAHGWYDLSEQSIRQRFLHVVKRMSPEQTRRRATVDFEQEVALVVSLSPQDGDELLGGARFLVEPGGDWAEVTFLVKDAFQGLGIASGLLERLMTVARSRGIHTFVAFVLESNQHMLSVFHRSSPNPVRSKLEDGVYEVRFSIRPEHDVDRDPGGALPPKPGDAR
ncbi:MAG: 4-hydroxybutyrate coenzyme A transferase [Planctomycetota bacterium]|nr:MAG: 4-hydroxybutyrate coenzyme A transferase [Planctomycetota bacterium]